MSSSQDSVSISTRYSPLDRLVILGTPLLFAVVMLFHPQGGDEGTASSLAASLEGQAGAWVIVHVAQLVLTVALGVAVWKLLEGLRGVAATVSRLAMATFTVFFSAYDSVAGLATGILVRYGQHLSGEDRTVVAAAVDYLFNNDRLAGNISVIGLIASGSWIVVAIATARALRRAGADRVTFWCMTLSLLFSAHGNIFIGPPGMILFLIAAYRWERVTARAGRIHG
jgi:hypothetical protein